MTVMAIVSVAAEQQVAATTMAVDPMARAVTRPLPLTEAIEALRGYQVKAVPGKGMPPASYAVAEKVRVEPIAENWWLSALALTAATPVGPDDAGPVVVPDALFERPPNTASWLMTPR
jgi:hypothetical protein